MQQPATGQPPGPRLPSPYAPPDLDVRALPEMPLAVERLRDSDAATLLPAEAFRAAVLLWAAAWHELPAGTLPDSDAHLARLAGFGRDLATWTSLKTTALHGFVLCRDGRWHHPVIVELALRERSALRARERLSEMQRAKALRSHQARRALAGKAAQAAPGYDPDPAGPGFTLIDASGAFAAGSLTDAAAVAAVGAAAAENGGKTAAHNSEQDQALACRGGAAVGAAAGNPPASPPSPSSPSSVSPLKNPPSTPPPPSPSTPPPPAGLGSTDPILVAGGAGALDLLGDAGQVKVRKSSATPPPCPVQEIVDAYHAALPMCPAVRVLADSTRKALVTRWREDASRQTLAWWEGYFRHVAADCPFLVGKTHHHFRASLEWLVGPKNFAKVVNGNYDREDEA